jgi:hypothetical protein
VIDELDFNPMMSAAHDQYALGRSPNMPASHGKRKL